MCTVPGSFGKRIDPVTVGTGVHDFHPISLAYVAGPWRVPLEFSLNYSDSNAWRDAIDEGRVTGAPMLDSSYVGSGWSTTLQESIVAMYADLQSNPRLSPNRFPWTANPCSTNERRADGSYTYKLLYRHPSGRTDEFGFLQSGSATGAEHCRVEGNDLVLSTR